MIELKNLDDRTLIQKLQALVAEEHKISTSILWHLLEVQKRRLFSDLGFSSLFDYCVKGPGYSESASQRRIEAMRLLREMPEIEHQYPNMSWQELIRYMAAQTLKKIEPTEKKARSLPAPEVKPASRYIPAPVRRAVWKRDQGKCVQCGSRYALQPDHYPVPYSQGGASTPENLQLTCRNCNQRRAIQSFGIEQMQLYLRC